MKNDFNINGMGNIPAGTYGDVAINGMGKLDGDIKAERVVVSGTSKGEGTLEVNEMTVNGQMKYSGKLNVIDKINVYGMALFGLEAKVNSLFVAGSVKFGENADFDKAIVNGNLTVKGDFEGADFLCNGKTNIEGLLNADNIEFKLNCKSTVKEIGGEKISVRRDEGAFFKLDGMVFQSVFSKIFGDFRLNSDVIEGDSIYLEYTTAKKVSGNNIVIGEGCFIDEINYSGSLDVSEKSEIKVRNNVGNLKLNLIKGV